MSLNKRKGQDDSFWISATDLMSGVMLVFLLISFAFIIVYKKQFNELVEYKSQKAKFEQNRKDLIKNFGDIGIQLDDNLSFMFDTNEVFKPGDATLSSGMKTDLKLFFDKVIPKAYELRDKIKEIRIEGYASSEWNEKGNIELTKSYKYIKNMGLSQQRTYSVTDYVLQQYSGSKYENWLLNTISSSGFSSSNFVYKKNKAGDYIIDINGNKIEDRIKSRRTGFSLVQAGEDKFKFGIK